MCLLPSSQGFIGVFLDARGNGLAGIRRSFALVLRTSPTALAARGADVSFGHGRCQVHDDVIMLSVIQQVHSLRCGYLAVKHDVTSQTRIYHYSILRQMALKGL